MFFSLVFYWFIPRGILKLTLDKAHSPLLLCFSFQPFSAFLCLKLGGERSKLGQRSLAHLWLIWQAPVFTVELSFPFFLIIFSLKPKWLGAAESWLYCIWVLDHTLTRFGKSLLCPGLPETITNKNNFCIKSEWCDFAEADFRIIILDLCLISAMVCDFECTEKRSETSCQPTDVLRYFSCSCVNSSGFFFQRGHFPSLPYPLLSILDKIKASALALGIWSQQPVLLFVTDNRDIVYCFNKESLKIICRWAWGTHPFGRLVCFELISLHIS